MIRTSPRSSCRSEAWGWREAVEHLTPLPGAAHVQLGDGCSLKQIAERVQRAVKEAVLRRHDGSVGVAAMRTLKVSEDVWYRVRRAG